MNSTQTTSLELEVTAPLPPAVHAGPNTGLDIADPVVTDEQFKEAAKALGVETLSPLHLEALSKAGIYLAGAGILKTQRGSVLVNQHHLLKAMSDTMEEMAKLKTANGNMRTAARVTTLERLIRSLCLLTDRNVTTAKFLTETQPNNRGPLIPEKDENEITQKSFLPGQQVILSRETHVHNGPGPKLP